MQINPGEKVSKSGDTMTGALRVNCISTETYPIIADRTHGSSSVKPVTLRVGNSTADGNVGSTYGILQLFSKGVRRAEISAPDLTNHRSMILPDESGTFILRSSETPITVTTTGNKTIKTMLQELAASLDVSKITHQSYVEFWSWSGGYEIFRLTYKETALARYSKADGSEIKTMSLGTGAMSSQTKYLVNGNEDTATTPGNGSKMIFRY